MEPRELQPSILTTTVYEKDDLGGTYLFFINKKSKVNL